METTDIDLDDIGAFFMKNSSPNVTLGVGPSIVPTTQTTVIKTEPKYFWQASEDSSSFSGTTNPWSTLSSSVPVNITTSGGGVASITTYNTSPLSDILTDLSSTSTSNTAQSLSPNLPSHSPSQVLTTQCANYRILLSCSYLSFRPDPQELRHYTNFLWGKIKLEPDLHLSDLQKARLWDQPKLWEEFEVRYRLQIPCWVSNWYVFFWKCMIYLPILLMYKLFSRQVHR